MPSILITGVSRGIGRQLAVNFASRGWSVMGTVRDMQQAPAGVTCFECDVTSTSSLLALQASLQHHTIDVLVCNAGVKNDAHLSVIGGMLQRAAEWEHIMKVNVIAPISIAELLLPCVARSDLKRIVMISSIMGSIASLSSPGGIAYPPSQPLFLVPISSIKQRCCTRYRSSKAALNMATKAMAVQVRRVTCDV